jgi:ATP-dependent Lhr-like helicase
LFYLRPDDAANVQVIEAAGGEAELRLQLRGYLAGGTDKSIPAPTELIAKHIFDHLRGTDNLVFAGSRQSVEIYADRLRTMCEDARLPQEFYPHHASLSRDHRDLVERRLKDGKLPTTAICTSTLELGIDIGDVSCVAQIGAPFSVASLRQRLGDLGAALASRRSCANMLLKPRSIEKQLCGQAPARPHPVNRHDRIATRKWCEPAQSGALHLDTGASDIVDHCRKGGAHALGSIVCSVRTDRSARSVRPFLPMSCAPWGRQIPL